ncbi:MAG: thioredoxin family protein [Holosporaceae bacterium]|nr:thioredoxin family protein [Holosporaceae bacterium]
MQKWPIILLSLLFLFDVAASPFDNLNIRGHVTKMDDKTFNCELILSISEGWKLPKAPDVFIQEEEQQQQEQSTTQKKRGRKLPIHSYKQLDGNTYRTIHHISAKEIYRNSSSNTLSLLVDCPLCKDICTIVCKRIVIPLGRTVNEGLENYVESSRLWVLLLGIIGGILLNVMPCVLPVIVMKLRSLKSRMATIGAIGGNYTCFAVVATCLVTLKAVGEKIGWGMHFQNPYFLECTALILFLLTMYSCGLIQWFPSIKTKKQEFWGSFLSSIVATVIAIPCTAPFLGTAATFAIQGTMIDLPLIFFAIATGFSVPYFLLLFVSPNFFTQFQRIGKKVKRTVDIGVSATFLWVFYLLSNYLSIGMIVLYGLSFVLSAILFWKQRYAQAGLILALCCLETHYVGFVVKEKDLYEREILAQVDSKFTKKQVILLNITADWCLTCKYNQHRILNSIRVKDALRKANVKFINADMTRRDDALMDFIHSHNRVGIPFTIVYGPHAPNGILLNEILTEDDVISALRKANEDN